MVYNLDTPSLVTTELSGLNDFTVKWNSSWWMLRCFTRFTKITV